MWSTYDYTTGSVTVKIGDIYRYVNIFITM